MATREGLKAVQMFEAIARGEIKALWVMATNPAVSLPRAAPCARRSASSTCSSSPRTSRSNDTVNAGAHVLLPAAAWGEKDGTVTNSERRISRQRAFLPLPGEAKPDWWIVTRGRARAWALPRRFAYRSAADMFPRARRARPRSRTTAARDFDLGGLGATIGDDAFDALDPVQWPLRAGEPRHARATVASSPSGGFFTR